MGHACADMQARDGAGSDALVDVLINIQTLCGPAHNDLLNGGHGVTLLYRDAGDDLLSGHGKQITVFGGGLSDQAIFCSEPARVF